MPINESADVNAKNNIGETPLAKASLSWSRSAKEIVELLISKGADVNAKDDGGWTPLDLARHNPETADLLCKHGGKTGEAVSVTRKIYNSAVMVTATILFVFIMYGLMDMVFLSK